MTSSCENVTCFGCGKDTLAYTAEALRAATGTWYSRESSRRAAGAAHGAQRVSAPQLYSMVMVASDWLGWMGSVNRFKLAPKVPLKY